MPAATRVLRSRDGCGWDAYVLTPYDDGPWFWVAHAFTRRGAQRRLHGFLRRLRQQTGSLG
jgi:hypothetical protein